MAKKELDRFDRKAKRDIQLSTKLIALIGGFILLGCSTVAIISLTVFDSKLIKNTQDELKYTEHGAANVMNDWLSTLTGFRSFSACRTSIIRQIPGRKLA